jgi:GTP cyclohydrolase FolE2
MIAEKLTDKYDHPIENPIPIDRSLQAERASSPVWSGVKGVKHYLETKIDGGEIVILCTTDITTLIENRGSHMSRHIESILEFPEEVENIEDIAMEILTKTLDKQGTTTGEVTTRFDYFFKTSEAVTIVERAYKSRGSLDVVPSISENEISLELPCINACPCALKESGGDVTHTQRVMVKVTGYFINIHETLDVIRQTVIPTKSLLKRDDEVELIRRAYVSPMFVEDIVRRLKEALPDCMITAEALESIHPHNAYAKST